MRLRRAKQDSLLPFDLRLARRAAAPLNHLRGLHFLLRHPRHTDPHTVLPSFQWVNLTDMPVHHHRLWAAGGGPDGTGGGGTDRQR